MNASDAIGRAHKIQAATSRYLLFHHLAFKIQHQKWFRLERQHTLIASIEINTDGQRIGLFAELIWLLYALLYAESIGAKPLMRITSQSYSQIGDGRTDYLQQYFLQPLPTTSMANASLIRKRISSLAQLPELTSRTQGMCLWKANELVTRYLPLRSEILDEAERFIEEDLGPHYIAVHWRGTDKHLEATPVDAQTIADKILRVAASMDIRPTHVFIASDQQDLIHELRDTLSFQSPDLMCVWRASIKRSIDGSPIHLQDSLSGAERYMLGKDALVDSLILSRSVVLIRTSSYLSAWSSIWNPALPVYMVNTPHMAKRWFPDAEIMLASRFYTDRLLTQSTGLDQGQQSYQQNSYDTA